MEGGEIMEKMEQIIGLLKGLGIKIEPDEKEPKRKAKVSIFGNGRCVATGNIEEIMGGAGVIRGIEAIGKDSRCGTIKHHLELMLIFPIED
ncbi:hypothetical protein KKA09_03725 [Patescibacteria group bacterium]|nr:hypothetical protein [Patescibacteria group bacterium]